MNLNFHFSHYKSMETLSCHSNQSAWATAIKKNIVEAIVRNNFAKFELYPPNSFWGADFWIFFLKFCDLVAMGTNQIKRLQKENVYFVEDHSRNISVNFLIKYLQWVSSKCQFSLFPIISQWQLYYSCHSNQSTYPIGTKIIIRSPCL